MDDDYLEPFPNLLALASPTTGVTHLICKLATKGSRVLPCGVMCNSKNLNCRACIMLDAFTCEAPPQAHSSTVERGMESRRFLFAATVFLAIGNSRTGADRRWMARYAKTIGMEVAAHDPTLLLKLNRRSLFSCPGRTLSPFRCSIRDLR